MSRTDLIVGPRHIPGSGRIRLKVEEVAKEKGFVVPSGPFVGDANTTAVTRGTRLSYSTVWPLLKHPERVERIHFDTLAQLCAVLDCQPGDLLEYVPEPRVADTPLSDAHKASAEEEAASYWK